MESISVYAQSVETNGEGDQVNVFLKNVDVSQVIAEFNSTIVLDALEYSDIMAYVTARNGENDEQS